MKAKAKKLSLLGLPEKVLHLYGREGILRDRHIGGFVCRWVPAAPSAQRHAGVAGAGQQGVSIVK